MKARSDTGRRTRLRVVTAVVCSLLVAGGGVLIAAPAQAAEPAGACVVTTGDLPGGVVLSGGGLSIGLPGCTEGGRAGQPPVTRTTITPVSTPVDGSEPTAAPETPGAPDPGATGDPAAPVAAAPVDPSTLTTSTPSAATAPTYLTVHRSNELVYPVEDGYLDVVRFSVRETSAAGDSIPLVGTAVLQHGSRTVKTWVLRGTTSVITWNGRVGSTIRPGLYSLRISVQAPDGTRRTDVTTVRVMGQHLVSRTLKVVTEVGARSTTAALPKHLIGAYRLGRVMIATRTVAVVHGPAELIFGSGDHRKVIRLRNGTHTTAPTVLPPGFDRTTISHGWKRGAARLKSLEAIWTYSALE